MSQLQVAAAGLLIARLSLVAFFLPSALGKFVRWHRFELGVREYAILPGWAIRPFATATPIIEAALAMALLLGVWLSIAGAATAALIAMFMVGVGINIHRGREVGCNCFGIAATKHLGTATMARLVSLMVLAALVTISASLAGPAGWRSPWQLLSSQLAPADGLAIPMLTAWCVLLVYILEWSVDTRREAKMAIARLRVSES